MTKEDIKAEAVAYIAERFSAASDPAYAQQLLIPGDRDFLLNLMAGFAAKIVEQEIEDLRSSRDAYE